MEAAGRSSVYLSRRQRWSTFAEIMHNIGGAPIEDIDIYDNADDPRG